MQIIFSTTARLLFIITSLKMPRSKITTSDMVVNYFRLIWTWTIFPTFFKTAFGYTLNWLVEIFWRQVSSLGKWFWPVPQMIFFFAHKTSTIFHVKCLFKHNFNFQIPFFNQFHGDCSRGPSLYMRNLKR